MQELGAAGQGRHGRQLAQQHQAAPLLRLQRGQERGPVLQRDQRHREGGQPQKIFLKKVLGFIERKASLVKDEMFTNSN